MTVMNPARMATGAAGGGDTFPGQKASAAHDRADRGFEDLLRVPRSPSDASRPARSASPSRWPDSSSRPVSSARFDLPARSAPPSWSAKADHPRLADAHLPKGEEGQAHPAALSAVNPKGANSPSCPAQAGYPRLAAAEQGEDMDTRPAPGTEGNGPTEAASLAVQAALTEDTGLTVEVGILEEDTRRTEEKDDDPPQPVTADPGLVMLLPAPPPPPPPAPAPPDSCEISKMAPAVGSASAALAGGGAPLAVKALASHDPDNLVEALGLHPVTPQLVAPGAPGVSPDPAPLAPPAVQQPGPAEPAAAAAAQPITAAGPHTSSADPTRQVAMRLKRAVNSGEDILTIELHPAELGRVSVRLGFHEGRVEVRLVVDQRSTFEAFSQDRAALEQQLTQAGIDLGGGGLDLRFGGGSQATPDNRPASAASAASTDPIATTHPVRLLAEGLVDIVA